MIDSYVNCNMKFKHDYLDHPDRTKESNALKFGSALHLAFKEHYEGNSALDTFNMYWNSIKGLETDERFSWEQLHDLANTSFIPNFIKLHSKKITPVLAELGIQIPFMGKHTMSGTIDLVCEIDGKLTILDYKTSASVYKKDKILKNPQMYMYAYMYYKFYGILPEQIMYKVFVKYDGRIQTITEDLTLDKLNSVISNVEVICKDILHRLETNSWYCNFNNPFCLTDRGCL